MKVVVTGVYGFIGRHLVSSLVNDGYEVIVIDILAPQVHGDELHQEYIQGVKFYRMDIRDIAGCYEILDGVFAIFHLVSETGTGQSMYNFRRYSDVNISGTVELLEAISKCSVKPKKVILSSSRSVYGEGSYENRNTGEILTPSSRSRSQLDRGVWEHFANSINLSVVATSESAPIRPASFYAATKAAQEFLLSSSLDAVGFQLWNLRFQNVYGEGQSLRNPYTGIISIFYNRIRQGLPIDIFEDGLESRDFVHVSDVVRALVSCLQVYDEKVLTMNIGSGQRTTVLDLVGHLINVSGFSTDIEITGNFRVGDIRHCYADITLAKEIMGFEPRVSLIDGLGAFVNWAKTQGTYTDKSESALSELRAKGLSK
jgi:dTDP-L-rhamnose 4-epimerase